MAVEAPKIRLLFVVPDLKGGGAPRVTLSLLGALGQRRYDLSLLNLGRRGEVLEAQVPRDVRLLRRPRWLPGLVGARLATLWHARRQHLLIAAVEMRATFCVHFAARLLRKPAMAWVHIAFEDWVRGFGERHHRRSRAAYAAIGPLVFVAEDARASMRRWLGDDRAHWRCIPNLFDAGAYPAGTPDPAQRALMARMQRGASVVGIGRLEARKGFDLLIAACALARNGGADFDLVILGEGALRPALLAQARDLGIGDRVFLPGHVDNPLPWLQAATLFVLSSRLEGLPTTIVESFWAGTPVVAADCPCGPREMLADGAGVLVPMDDAPGMAVAIADLLDDPAARTRLAHAGRAALTRYAPSTVLPQWESAIAQALGTMPRA